jgi:polar amino acid transport system substrate-binding protein
VQGSTSVEYLKEQHIDVTEFPQAEDTFRALQQGQVDVVVYDAPVLLYYASHAGNGKVRPVGSIFRTEDYGIVFPTDTRYRKRVNMALLKIKEAGIYDRLYQKWFGASGS